MVHRGNESEGKRNQRAKKPEKKPGKSSDHSERRKEKTQRDPEKGGKGVSPRDQLPGGNYALLGHKGGFRGKRKVGERAACDVLWSREGRENMRKAREEL